MITIASNEIQSVCHILLQDNFINVIVDHSIADAMSGCTISCMARSYLFEITYYQTGQFTETMLLFRFMSEFERQITPYYGRLSLSCFWSTL